MPRSAHLGNQRPHPSRMRPSLKLLCTARSVPARPCLGLHCVALRNLEQRGVGLAHVQRVDLHLVRSVARIVVSRLQQRRIAQIGRRPLPREWKPAACHFPARLQESSPWSSLLPPSPRQWSGPEAQSASPRRARPAPSLTSRPSGPAALPGSARICRQLDLRGDRRLAAPLRDGVRHRVHYRRPGKRLAGRSRRSRDRAISASLRIPRLRARAWYA